MGRELAGVGSEEPGRELSVTWEGEGFGGGWWVFSIRDSCGDETFWMCMWLWCVNGVGI